MVQVSTCAPTCLVPLLPTSTTERWKTCAREAKPGNRFFPTFAHYESAATKTRTSTRHYPNA